MEDLEKLFLMYLFQCIGTLCCPFCKLLIIVPILTNPYEFHQLSKISTKNRLQSTKNFLVTRLFELAQIFKAVNIDAIALFASRNIMSCLEKCPYNHRKTKFWNIKKRILNLIYIKSARDREMKIKLGLKKNFNLFFLKKNFDLFQIF